MILLRVLLTVILFVFTFSANLAQDSNIVYYSLFMEKSVGFGTIDTKVLEGEFNEGGSFIIPETVLPTSPFDFSLYQDLYNALVGAEFSLDYGALNNDIIMKIYIRNLNPDEGAYLNLGEQSDTLFSYFEIRIWELPDSNYYPEEQSYYFNEGYYARFNVPKSDGFNEFINFLGIDEQDDLAFAFLEDLEGNIVDWNGFGIETINTTDYVEFRAIHLSRIGGGKRKIANNIIDPDTISAMNIVRKDELSDQFYLAQNYPNPFNPTTTIKYSIVKEGHVSLSVYSILGNHILTLVDEYQSKGNYEVEFSSDKLDNHFASGVYFYSLNQNNSILTKKMILTK
ncbi:MAG: T9SS type A sorting domain-containing protein [Melioribacteraceae bacterium]|nr:T9SS type A sorting domain-containing protein [Melioribacteraceae bacterium]